MKQSRIARGIAAAAGVSIVLAGCAGGGSMSDGSGGDAKASAVPWNPPTTDLTDVTLSFGGGTAGGPIDQVLAAFQKATNVKIKRVSYPDPYEQNLLTKVATGDKPDFAAWQPTASLADRAAGADQPAPAGRRAVAVEDGPGRA